jgi:N4-bis(aminopropyl)spermidine synthase
VEATLRPDDGVAGWLLTHVHGKVGNVLRDALVRAEPGLSRAEAQAQAAARIGRDDHLEARLIDLPRHTILSLLRS